ncbi:FGGY carbohydrate kinase domain-containing protein [Macrosteles quadrilineatus]|uniref:FGGY carbohydrate kinase domain-containing protein n=1 Tax=Macrosteles quadrilineatus TaxID=74068 RepID=UPI0023E2ED02|nr:FGGY carbohydrate kinase domain-containing protein [Macrosteles quadrilineatus]
MSREQYVVGVDVGTGSVRAALVRSDGSFVKVATQATQTWNPAPGYYQQSSMDIWYCCCKVIKEVLKDVAPEQVKGLGFDATCSLVVLDQTGKPLTVSPTGEVDQNIILWMDHRAHHEAKLVNDTKHEVLKYVGGKISLEMEIPKLMWLKKCLPKTWKQAGKFFDLPDFLTWKATGTDSRSLCSVVCKWTYEVDVDTGVVKGWNRHFFGLLGLSDLLDNDCAKIGQVILPPGSPCGSGLSAEAAKELGLIVGTPVATSIIDAHAGGLGLIGCTFTGLPCDFTSRLCLICGTSSCHMAVSQSPIMVPGVWGPYFSAMVPALWLSEGGQSATGKLLDHIIDTHPATAGIRAMNAGIHLVTYLNKLLEQLASSEGLDSIDQLTQDLHVWPDLHGNRSPLADPTLRGMVSGLTLSSDSKDLALLYLATVQALAYGTRHILDSLETAGHHKMECLLICGGLSKNPVFVKTQASVIGRAVLLPQRTEAVLGGAAMLAAFAAGLYPFVEAAVTAMAGPADLIEPDAHSIEYHNRKYTIFLKMVEDQQAYRNIMHSK